MDELKDLSLLAQNACSFISNYNGVDFELPISFKQKVTSINNNTIKYNQYSAILETKGTPNGTLNIYMPNQWFYIASYFTELYNEMMKYKEYALLITTKDRLKILNGLSLNSSEINNLNSLNISATSKQFLIKFITDYAWWGGAKTIDRVDFYVSPILSHAKLVNASHTYVADLCAFLAGKQKLVQEIINHVPSNKKILPPLNEPLQQIFYGAPGTGKSHKTNEVAEKYDGTIRTTFHPDSDYSTFVGAYKPVEIKEEDEPQMQTIWDFTSKSAISIPVLDTTGKPVIKKGKSKITYDFVKQAFTKAYLLAWKKYAEQNGGTQKTITASHHVSATHGVTGTNTTFPYLSLNGVQLTSAEEDELLNVDNFAYPFVGWDNLGDLHEKKINVVVTDRPQEDQKITSTFTKKDLEYLETLMRDESLGFDRNKIDDILEKAKEKLGNEDSVEVEMNLLGLYDSNTKTVYLFMDNIHAFNADYLLPAVYIHEMYHAYFDNGITHAPEIEEPIVECATLKFLEKFNINYVSGSAYLESVDQMKSTLFGYYGLGVDLYKEGSDWTDLYYNGKANIILSSQKVREYISMFHPIFPFKREIVAISLLHIILSVPAISANPSGRCLIDPQFLVIEEINRGNCAQIFGDLFQLLDRQDNGFSEYPIEADADLQKAIKIAFEEEEEFKLSADLAVDHVLPNYKSAHGGTLSKDIQDGHILLLPNNLYIWATMNTSDQSLFPMDSAFKRRWDWVYMPIDTKKEEWTIKIGDNYSCSWTDFLEAINEKIYDTTQSEDKQLGFYFCKAKDGVVDAETFVGKVLFYLWNDVFKDYGFEDPIFNLAEKDSNGVAKKMTYHGFYKGYKEVNEDNVIKFLKNLLGEKVDENENEEEEDEESDKDDAKGQYLEVKFSDGTIFNKSKHGNSSNAFKEAVKYIQIKSEKSWEELVGLNIKINGRPGNPDTPVLSLTKQNKYSPQLINKSPDVYIICQQAHASKKKSIEEMCKVLSIDVKAEVIEP